MEKQRALAATELGDLAALEGLLAGSALGAGLVHHAARAAAWAASSSWCGQRDHKGVTAAHAAAAKGHLAKLRWLVRDGGCGLQDQDASGVSPLHLAAHFGEKLNQVITFYRMLLTQSGMWKRTVNYLL